MLPTRDDIRFSRDMEVGDEREGKGIKESTKTREKRFCVVVCVKPQAMDVIAMKE